MLIGFAIPGKNIPFACFLSVKQFLFNLTGFVIYSIMKYRTLLFVFSSQERFVLEYTTQVISSSYFECTDSCTFYCFNTSS